MHRVAICTFLMGLVVWCTCAIAADAPLEVVVDLKVGETQNVTLTDGKTVTVKLVDLDEQRDPLRDAVRQARVTIELNGQRTRLISGNYRLPLRTEHAQVDCTITRGYNKNGSPESWGLDKDARLRLWPAESPWIAPDTFIYPVKQRWFAALTQMSNEPVFVDGGERANQLKIYYHSGLDIGGSEGQVEVIAATDGLVVSVGTNVLAEHKQDTPVAPRYDVVYIQDLRGWYYRYSHLKEIDPQLLPGRRITKGQRVGLLGKEGGSGGWSHLHFEIKSRQPSGKWGTHEGYAFLWQAYVAQYKPSLVAVARPHRLARVGDAVELDASRSWIASKKTLQYRWKLLDGSTVDGPRAVCKYDKPGTYSEVLEIRDQEGNIDYDFAIVQVLDPTRPNDAPPTIHPAFYPTMGIAADDAVTFKVRTFRTTDGEETWDFGDGSPPEKVHSDGNVKQLAPDGYAVTTHRYQRPGHYVVRVQRTNGRGETAIGHLHVVIEERK